MERPSLSLSLLRSLRLSTGLFRFVQSTQQNSDSEHIYSPAALCHVTQVTRKRRPFSAASDASQIGICSYFVARTGSVFFQDNLTEEARLGSGHHELLTGIRTLQAIKSGHPFKGRQLIWLTDSTNLCAFLSNGSMKPRVQADILEIFWICREFRIRITPVHLSRSDFCIQATDTGTHFFDPDDWCRDAARNQAS